MGRIPPSGVVRRPLARSSSYWTPAPADSDDLVLMRRIDECYLERPFFGSRQMAAWLSRDSAPVNRKRVQRLMRRMGLQGAVPGPHTSRPHPAHSVYPYLLAHLTIDRPNLVWSSDITYVPRPRGFLYLVAVMDWYSRYVLAWRLSNTLEAAFCVEALWAPSTRASPWYLTPTKAPSSPARSLPGVSSATACSSAWTVAAGRSIMCSSNASGAVSNTKKSTCVITRTDTRSTTDTALLHLLQPRATPQRTERQNPGGGAPKS